jgi:hypothetical protein
MKQGIFRGTWGGIVEHYLRLCLMAVLALAAPLANASLLSSIGYTSCDFACTNPTNVNQSAQSGIALSFSDGYGSVFAQADYGTLKASIDSSFVSNGTGSFISESTGAASSGFSDWIAFGGITGPQLVTIVLRLDGSIGATGDEMPSTSANVGVSLGVNGRLVSLNADRFGTITNLHGTYSQSVLTATFELDYGVLLSLDGSLDVSGSFGGYAHYGHTVDLEFVAPAGTTIRSDSGAVYRLSQGNVPEPATCVLMSIALAALAIARHRPRRA